MAGEDVAQVQDVAAGNVRTAGAFVRARGCTVVRTGQGVYEITIDPNNNVGPNLPQVEAVTWVQCTALQATQRVASIEHQSDSVKVVNIDDDLGAPIDNDFEFRLGRLLG